MWVFVSYEKQRKAFMIGEQQTVKGLLDDVRETFHIGEDQAPGGVDGTTREMLTLHHAGADLHDDWILADLGLAPGSTLTITMREEMEPVLYIKCLFSQETVSITEKIRVPLLTVYDLRSMVTRKTGLPIGVFRLVSQKGTEMFDAHTMYDYGVEIGDTVLLEVWDGMADLLNAAIVGLTSKTFNTFHRNEVLSRYQMRVALHICAHFGHVDLASGLLRNGVRADEPVGEHPTRLWCQEENTHIDRLRCPIHVAAEMGQLAIFRTFVHVDTCTIFASDGNGLKPLNIALRNKQKAIVQFLLTKQWTTVNYGSSKQTIPLYLYSKLKKWGDRARDKVITKYGLSKSSMKNPRKYVPELPLVSMGVYIKGSKKEHMASKSLAQFLAEEERKNQMRERIGGTGDSLKGPHPDPEMYFAGLSDSMGGDNTVDIFRMSMAKRRMSRGYLTKLHSKSFSKLSLGPSEGKSIHDQSIGTNDCEQKSKKKVSIVDTKDEKLNRKSEKATEDGFKLPPLGGDLRRVKTGRKSASHQNLSTGIVMEPEFEGSRDLSQSRASFIQTGTSYIIEDDEPNDDPGNVSDNVEYKSLPKIKLNVIKRGRRLRNSEISDMVLSQYEQLRGLPASEYASKCMSVANNFKQKPWLQQVRQAMIIATRGVNKTLSRQSNFFHPVKSKPSRLPPMHEENVG